MKISVTALLVVGPVDAEGTADGNLGLWLQIVTCDMPNYAN